MKLGIFIPAYNEEKAIEAVIKAIPSQIPGINEIKVFVIDDGSSDKTASVARQAGAEVVEIKPNRGLANAYKVGLATCLQAGADLITHLDADGQYNPAEIPAVITPIIRGQADFVTGDRRVEKTAFLGPARKYGNMVGSWFLRVLSGLKINDVSCGFRAYSRQTAEKIEVYSSHTYTHETLIEAKYKGFKLAQVPVGFNPRGKKGDPKQDQSRLTSNLVKHIFSSLKGIFEAKKRYSKLKKAPLKGEAF